jgi:hypothetical protein
VFPWNICRFEDQNKNDVPRDACHSRSSDTISIRRSVLDAHACVQQVSYTVHVKIMSNKVYTSRFVRFWPQKPPKRHFLKSKTKSAPFWEVFIFAAFPVPPSGGRGPPGGPAWRARAFALADRFFSGGVFPYRKTRLPPFSRIRWGSSNSHIWVPFSPLFRPEVSIHQVLPCTDSARSLITLQCTFLRSLIYWIVALPYNAFITCIHHGVASLR